MLAHVPCLLHGAGEDVGDELHSKAQGAVDTLPRITIRTLGSLIISDKYTNISVRFAHKDLKLRNPNPNHRDIFFNQDSSPYRKH